MQQTQMFYKDKALLVILQAPKLIFIIFSICQHNNIHKSRSQAISLIF